MSEHCDQVDEAMWIMGCRDCCTEYIRLPGPFHHNLDSLLFNCKSKPQIIIIIIIIMRQVMAYKCSYKLPIYMGKVYKGWKGHV